MKGDRSMTIEMRTSRSYKILGFWKNKRNRKTRNVNLFFHAHRNVTSMEKKSTTKKRPYSTLGGGDLAAPSKMREPHGCVRRLSCHVDGKG